MRWPEGLATQKWSDWWRRFRPAKGAAQWSNKAKEVGIPDDIVEKAEDNSEIGMFLAFVANKTGSGEAFSAGCFPTLAEFRAAEIEEIA